MATAIGELPIVEVDTIGNATRASPQRDDTTDAPPPVETSGVVCDVNFENHVDGQEDTPAATADTADEESPTDGLVDGDKKRTSTNESLESNHDANEESEEAVESDDDGIGMFPEPHECNTDSLYKLYVERLKYQQEWKSSGQETKESKAPKMVRGIVDYVRTLEDRIQELESSEARRAEKEKEKERQQTDEETGVGRSKPSDAVNEWAQVVLEIKLFHVDGEFDGYGNWQNNRFKKGSYQCTLDTNSLIRALYSWTEGATPSHIHQQPLDPEHTDILIFGIMSKPVASFFRDRLGIGDNSTSLSMRIGKPFRPLIRNLQPVRDQLGKLEEKYRVADPKTPTDEPKANDATENDTAAKEDDVLPFPATLEDGKKELEWYETKEALLHFRMLLEFVEKYLHEKVTLFDRLKKGLEDKIAFEDLWMLFDTGDTIYSPYVEGGVVLKSPEESHTTKTRYVPQAFRVLSTAGGLPWRKTLAPKQSDPGGDILGNTFFSKWPIKGLRHAALPEMQDGIPSAQRNKDKFAPLYVVCFNIDFNGVKYGPVHEIFIFRPYDGLVDITSLEAYPIQYLKNQPGRFPGGDEQPEEDSLLQRGRKFIDATAVSHLSHEGLSVGKSRHEINSAVIVDFKLSFQEYVQEFPDHENIVPSFTPAAVSGIISREEPVIEFYVHQCGDSWCHRNGCVFEAYSAFQSYQMSQITSRTNALLEEDETVKLTKKESLQKFKKYMEDNDLIRLLPGVVPGFALRNRKWVQLDLNQLEELKQEDEWKKLVLPDGHREMVQAMVETHTRGSQDSKWVHNTPKAKVQMDLVQGKGRGCIILLHGVPGVGKTSTAECVAAHTRRPLYPITCGDVGYLPEAVEMNMEQHFKLAHAWGCVLLLDEADVFLAKRNKTDVKRNGLVSVFLRILEYYSGILFLTTNRVGAIDDAFRSRLHLTLYYPKLTEKQTTEIWKNNLGRIKEINRERKEMQQPLIKFDKAKILRWVKLNRTTLQWNGRQIRNAFQTAVALAEFTAKHDASKESSKKKGMRASGPVIDIKHFMTIAEAAIQFDQYMIAVYGDNEDNLAAREQMRPKSFTPKAPKLKDLEDEESSESSESSSEDEEATKSEAADESVGEMSSDDNGGKSSEDLESESESESEKERKKKRKKTIKKEKKKDKRESKSSSSKDKKEKKGK